MDYASSGQQVRGTGSPVRAALVSPEPGWDAWRKEMAHSPPLLRLDGTVSYLEGWSLLVPAESGVFFLHDFRGFLYIGRTKNLNLRYRQHHWVRRNARLLAALRAHVGQVEFSWIACPPNIAMGLERNYLHSFLPLANSIRCRPAIANCR